MKKVKTGQKKSPSVGKWLPKSQTNWTKSELKAVKTKGGVKRGGKSK